MVTMMHLNEREQAILRQVISVFIASGQPVASRAVLATGELSVSSATVRSVMASLEERGFLSQPHTSAGRVPTLEAMRHYVSQLVMREPVEAPIASRITRALSEPVGVDGLLESTSQVLSAVTSLAALASPPSSASVRLRRLELVWLSAFRVLAVVVTEAAQVHHRIVELALPVARHELERMQNFLGEALVGLNLVEARQRLRDEIRDEKLRYDQMIRTAVEVAHQALDRELDEALVIKGELNFLSLEDFAEPGQVRQLLQDLRDRRRLLEILEQLELDAGTQVIVGPLDGGDAQPPVLNQCSLILAPYGIGGQRLGWVGIVGPVRMRYAALIPVVEVAARALSSRCEGSVVA